MKLLMRWTLALGVLTILSCNKDQQKDSEVAFDSVVGQFADIKVLRYQIPCTRVRYELGKLLLKAGGYCFVTLLLCGLSGLRWKWPPPQPRFLPPSPSRLSSVDPIG